jgi:ParB/RepB/Spo0J family partition protein
MTQPVAGPPPPMPETFTTLSPDSICLQHNIRDGEPVDAIIGDDDFVQSIASQGILVRCTVRRGPCEHGKEYVAIAGHRRIITESHVRGLEGQVPVEIIDEDRELDVVYMLVENMQRKDLTALEEARGYGELVREYRWSQADVARSVGKSTSHVSERVQLLGLTELAKDKINDGSLPVRAALKLTKLPHALVDEVLAIPGQKSEHYIDHDIKAVQRKHAAKKLAAEQMAALTKAGANVVTKNPAGSVLVLLKGESHYAPNALRLDMTPAQFYKEPCAFVVVKAASSFYDTAPSVKHYTADKDRYLAQDGAGAKHVAAANTATADYIEGGATQDELDTIHEHRRAWFRTFARNKPANDVVLRQLVPILWNSISSFQARELADALGLLADDDDPNDRDLPHDRLKAYVSDKKMAEQLRICYLAWYAADLNDGIGQYHSRHVPKTLLAAGYDPTDLEQIWMDADDEERTKEWAEYRKNVVEDYDSVAETGEMDEFLAACETDIAAGNWPDDFDHPLVETWDQRLDAAEVDTDPNPTDEDGNDAEPEMTAGEAIGEERAGE